MIDEQAFGGVATCLIDEITGVDRCFLLRQEFAPELHCPAIVNLHLQGGKIGALVVRALSIYRKFKCRRAFRRSIICL